jgi:type IV secretory pathway TraG/TraD family ATPase VirD4
MRNIIGQTKSAFSISEVMDTNKILLIGLSKGILGDLNSNLLGLILVSKIQAAAMARQNMAKESRQDFFLYIDEFQNYITDSIESILSEARKYRLGLIIAHQYLGQLQKSDALTKSNVNLKDAIFGNVGSIMSYKIGPEDAEFMTNRILSIWINLRQQ